MSVLLEMRDIRKQYPGVLALNNVHFELQAGEVHCLVGENGAGKSTLIKILSGALHRDSGEIIIEEKNVDIRTPIDSQRLGIGIIYQDIKLVPELSVAENILLGSEPMKGRSPFVDYRTMHEIARKTLEQLGEEIGTNAPVSSLRVAQQQIVEIAKAISKNVRILAMDEPSSALTEHELNNLFKVIRRLKSEGVGIVYISHRLDEIFEIGDRITVLRDGSNIHTCLMQDADRRSLVRWMVGREMESEYPKIQLQRGGEILRVERLHGGILHDIHLSLYRGEVLGLAGLVGAGRSELARIIFGADPKTEGKIFLEGKEINPRTPREAIDYGIGLLTEDRNRYGLIMQMHIAENISLANLRDLLQGPFIKRKKEFEIARRYVDELRIKAPTVEEEVENLSGGNRQKVVLARWLYTKSKVLIFDEPTAGIDVGVKYEIYTLLNRLAEEGIGVMVISSELPELLGICDRIVVLCEGRITGIVTREEATQEKVMTLATGGVSEVQNAH